MNKRHLPYLLLSVLALSACGGGGETKTVTERTVTEKQPAAPKSAPKASPRPKARSSAGGSITVPNVVGKNHQLAQDTMQEAGLYALAEKDATGQDRVLLYDRNWEVVRQTPAAGSKVDEDTTITLSAKKTGE